MKKQVVLFGTLFVVGIVAGGSFSAFADSHRDGDRYEKHDDDDHYKKHDDDDNRCKYRGKHYQNRLSSEERAAYHQARAAVLQSKFDVNQDGSISLDEVQAVKTDFFQQADTDKNGSLSVEEFEVASLKYNEEMFKLKMRKRFQRLDNNADGILSSTELVGITPVLDRLDTDANGIISNEELNNPVYRKKHHH